MIAVHHHEVTKCSDKKMERGNGFRTIDCLRGRLVAERQASKMAEEEADVMTKKVTELENKLKEETKLRNKAEKRLKLLKKKLEFFKMPPILEESNSSDNSAFSCGSSSSTPNSSVDEKSKTQISQILKNNEEEINSYESNLSSISIDDNDDGYVDESLAIVEVKIVEKSVCEVLEALKHAREKIQTSLERRHMVRVGPINS